MGTAQYYNNATNTSDDGGVSYYLKRAPCDVNVSTIIQERRAPCNVSISTILLKESIL